MVKLIVGNKGSGKTKTLLERIRSAASSSKGNVICIEKGESLRFDLKHDVRLINVEEYGIAGADAYRGFIAGLLAGNYDITEIFADAAFKILCGKDSKDFDVLAKFIESVDKLSANGPTITFTISCDESEVPAPIAKFIEK